MCLSHTQDRTHTHTHTLCALSVPVLASLSPLWNWHGRGGGYSSPSVGLLRDLTPALITYTSPYLSHLCTPSVQPNSNVSDRDLSCCLWAQSMRLLRAEYSGDEGFYSPADLLFIQLDFIL